MQAIDGIVSGIICFKIEIFNVLLFFFKIRCQEKREK